MNPLFIQSKFNKTLFLVALAMLFFGCNSKSNNVDYIYFNGQIITMNDSLPDGSVIVVKNKKIEAIGGNELLSKYECKAENKINLNNQIVYPGFIDAHCHFYGYAKTLLNCDLTKTNSWQQCIKKLVAFEKEFHPEWIVGRGWDQNDWEEKEFPNNEMLNKLFANTAVFLQRIDGHAAICNEKALKLAGIDENTKIVGGEIIIFKGKLSGVVLDNAADLVKGFIPENSKKDIENALVNAEKNCFSFGLTTLADAGLDIETILEIEKLYKTKKLNIFQYFMLNPTDAGFQFAQKNGVVEKDYLKIGSFKLYADGALGSRGAKLKTPYCDQKENSGLLLHSVDYFNEWCAKIAKMDYQVNTHCIGDSANRLLLEIYGRYLKGKNDRRWRIEHAQVIDPQDFELFAKYSIIPSVQPTHATSDGPWAEHRLCSHRLKGAYAYKTLLNQNQYLPLGTDFPVEGLSPLNTFYSAVFRSDINDIKNKQFLLNESLSPWEALQGITTWAAKSCKLEHRKGQLAKGMDADFVVLNKNLLNIRAEDFKQIKVLFTVLGGNVVYKRR